MVKAALRAAYAVMAGLVPAIHVLFFSMRQDVDARDTPGHDELPDLHGEPLSNVIADPQRIGDDRQGRVYRAD
jgi:hypothetical protein